MANYKEIVLVTKYTDRDGHEKSKNTRIGVAFQMRNDPTKLTLKFDAYPADPSAFIVVQPPRERNQQGGQQGGGQQQGVYGNQGQQQGGQQGGQQDVPF
jgi:hypothetical protein